MKVLLVTITNFYGLLLTCSVLPMEALHGRSLKEFEAFLQEQEEEETICVQEIDLSKVELWRFAPPCPHIGRRDD